MAPRWAHIALKIGQHSPKMGQHSPKIGRRPSKYPAFYSVFLLFPFFGSFGSTWVNIGFKIGQPRPKTGQHSAKVGQHSPKMDQHSRNIALRSCSQLDPYHLNMGPWPAVARKRLNPAMPRRLVVLLSA